MAARFSLPSRGGVAREAEGTEKNPTTTPHSLPPRTRWSRGALNRRPRFTGHVVDAEQRLDGGGRCPLEQRRSSVADWRRLQAVGQDLYVPRAEAAMLAEHV
jgi:hypothetical protein